MDSAESPLILRPSPDAAHPTSVASLPTPALVGFKARTLMGLARAEFPVPEFRVLTTHAYRRFVAAADLDAWLRALLDRRPLESLRWEELWDLSLAVRNRFLTTPYPDDLRKTLVAGLGDFLHAGTVAVRSSAPDEDAPGRSLAGLHDSKLHVRGLGAALDAIRLVWASLFSERALSYRREIGLDPLHSTMAVVIQRQVAARAAGVLFTAAPDDEDAALIEAAPGLADDLVSGRADPTTIRINLRTGSYDLPADSPLAEDEISALVSLGAGVEYILGGPVDVEFACDQTGCFLVQARRSTARQATDDAEAGLPLWKRKDQRPWHRTLVKSFAELERLRERVEGDVLPAMEAQAQALAACDPAALDNPALAAEITRRAALLEHWRDRYWADCIPLAHGMRLFGQIHNERLKPADPHAFIDLLSPAETIGLARNRRLQTLAGLVRKDPALKTRLLDGEVSASPEFDAELQAFLADFGEISCLKAVCEAGPAPLVRLVLALADKAPAPPPPKPDLAALEAAWFAAFPHEEHGFARTLLELGRASWRLRDDDNLPLARIEAKLDLALIAAKLRLKLDPAARFAPANLAKALIDASFTPPPAQSVPKTDKTSAPALLVGSPASPGFAQAKARVVLAFPDLFTLEAGEILVVDALEPAMTLVAPLIAGIVERRGGMLVHSAIAAREYAVPCVVGVKDAATRIRTGDLLELDGFAGTVRVLPRI